MNISGLTMLLLFIFMLFNCLILLLTNHEKKIRIRVMLTIDFSLLYILFIFIIVSFISLKKVEYINLYIAAGIFTFLYDVILFNLVKIMFVQGYIKTDDTFNNAIAEAMIHLSNGDKKSALSCIKHVSDKNPGSVILVSIKNMIDTYTIPEKKTDEK
ncbi:MAG: hypothetical protein A2015_08825 [Spirochaetes bacterium GWF1_31_7]|nr:MAG: hypothetical protein A2Y30_06835 [Spirochaetes bacterium GWE1_32_154]OHD48024.1 MAG: hypothetical protein A2015_08825 [Spirochaetes bacterium GWF1_31_7]OHD49659.1 MAG: hypothetical protein A2Y29_06810 [Spirochaetes bacterium GWE2_31_10]HBD92763.1 hypothetical protein [Spirochaetia bacterium]HBI36450.1 hypothetical protein [Spirochaetia bacterium]